MKKIWLSSVSMSFVFIFYAVSGYAAFVLKESPAVTISNQSQFKDVRSYARATSSSQGSISGTLIYSGNRMGAIYVGVFTTPLSCTTHTASEPFASVELTSIGSYTLTGLPDGTYYLASVISTAGPDGGSLRTDPWGIYNGCSAISPITINGGAIVAGIDITLVDGTVAAPNPFFSEENKYHLTVSGNSNGTVDLVKSENELWYSGFGVTGDGGGRDSGDGAILPFATHSSPLAYLPPRVGQSWSDTGDSNGYRVDSIATVKSVSETISTPAGTFSNCAYVEESLSYPNGHTPGQPQPPIKYERWFCPGIGPVKVVITDNSAHTGELVSYRNITARANDYFPLGLQFSWTFRMVNGRTATWTVTESSAAINSPCTATLSPALSLHIPVLIFNKQAYWIDFSYIANTLDFNLTDAGVVSDITPFSSCTPATLSTDFELHIPTLTFGGVSYWADFQYTHDLIFTLTGAGGN